MSEAVSTNDLRAKLVSEIKRVCERYDGLASSDALRAARNPKDTVALQNAQKSVAIADALGVAYGEIWPLVNNYWALLEKHALANQQGKG